MQGRDVLVLVLVEIDMVSNTDYQLEHQQLCLWGCEYGFAIDPSTDGTIASSYAGLLS